MGCLNVTVSRIGRNGKLTVSRIGTDGTLTISPVCSQGVNRGFLRDKYGVYIKDIDGRYIMVLTD